MLDLFQAICVREPKPLPGEHMGSYNNCNQEVLPSKADKTALQPSILPAKAALLLSAQGDTKGSVSCTLPTPTVELPKAGALHQPIETLLLDQFQDLRLNLLF